MKARRVGGRFKYLWLATLFHGLVVECVCFVLPDIDNYWHSQTTIVLLARRLPIHIMMLCTFDRVQSFLNVSIDPLPCPSVYRSNVYLQRVRRRISAQVAQMGGTSRR